MGPHFHSYWFSDKFTASPATEPGTFNSLRRIPSLSITVGLTRVLVLPESNWVITLSLHPDEGTYNSTGIVTGILG